tara:strand:+ start:454 stop:3105 length:2652 start_codon:yes stop_codon:yes gene_type:complete
MAAVTQRIHNYLSGVSKQPDSKKLPGQVRECLNGFPDITTGLTKRPGFKFLSVLKNSSNTPYSGVDLDGSKWFYINRGDGTKYIGCITPKDGNTNGTIHIWNADTGAVCTITDTTTSSALGAHSYLTGAKVNYDVLTVHDSTLITNNTVTITAQAAPAFVAKTRGTLLLLGTDSQMGSETFTATVAGQTATYTSQATDGYDEVLAGLRSAIQGLGVSGITATIYGTSLQIDRVVSGTRTAFTLTAKGGKDNKGIVVYQDWADDPSWLPPHSFHGHVVEIINSRNTDQDNYYAKFVANNGVNDFGYWQETIGPGVSPGLNKSTMPHVLLCTGTNTFTFGERDYTDRNVGDDITNKHPSFVGKTIQQAFFHSNRLGFLTEDNVSMSKAADPFNFYHTTARTITDGDPVDLSATSVRPALLHAVRPTTQGLVLFSKSQQFLMYSDAGPLTPTATKIRPISNMEMDDGVEPIDIGTHMNFISKTPNYTRVFSYQTRGLQENPAILDIGRVVNEWITIDVDTLIASVQNDFIAMSSQSSNEIFFYKTYTDGEQLLMESWFKWKLPGLVKYIAVDQDDMYTVTKQGNQYTLSKANLTQSPEASIIISNAGQKVNPCVDLYAQATSVVYDSANDRSKCYIPFANLTDKKPLVVVGGTTAAGTYNNSGFNISPEVGTDGSGTFFIVPGQDLSGNANNVYVGYAYDFDVILPELFYNLDDDGKNSDFTANLTIARLKFDVGLSGLMGFKLNAVGRFAGKREYIGDNSTTDYNWSKEDLDYVDRNQVKVKINNVTSTAFSFLSDTQIRFSSAPGTGDKIVIYLDEWYQLQPTTSANTYLADDVPLDESTVFTVPIHQRSKNFTLRLFNDSPFPVSLNSMMWEGNYSPRFYRRT